MKFQVELFGRQTSFALEDEKGNTYSVIENYDANSDSVDVEILKEGEPVEDSDLADEILDAVRDYVNNSSI